MFLISAGIFPPLPTPAPRALHRSGRRTDRQPPPAAGRGAEPSARSTAVPRGSSRSGGDPRTAPAGDGWMRPAPALPLPSRPPPYGAVPPAKGPSPGQLRASPRRDEPRVRGPPTPASLRPPPPYQLLPQPAQVTVHGPARRGPAGRALRPRREGGEGRAGAEPGGGTGGEPGGGTGGQSPGQGPARAAGAELGYGEEVWGCLPGRGVPVKASGGEEGSCVGAKAKAALGNAGSAEPVRSIVPSASREVREFSLL